MSTRGFIGLVIDGQEKITYNHSDSYPDWLGVRTLADVRDLMLLDEDLLKQLARDLEVVEDEDATPTREHLQKFGHFADPNVGGSNDKPADGHTVQNYYQLLRNLQGHFADTLQLGLMTDGSSFPIDSLFCEWGYLVDFDARTFEVYRGFQKEYPTEGRWIGRPNEEEKEADYQWMLETAKAQKREPWREKEPEYKAVQRIASWSFDDLPDDEDFLGTLMVLQEQEG